MKKHPDGQPCSSVTVESSDNNPGDTDQQFLSKRIYDDTSLDEWIRRRMLNGAVEKRQTWDFGLRAIRECVQNKEA